MVIINIDTQKDSHDEIKKTIQYLQQIVGDYAQATSLSSTSPADTSTFMNIFDTNSSKSDSSQTPSMSIFSEETTTQLTQDEQDAETLLKTVSDATVEFDDDDDDSVIEIVEYD